MYLTTAPRSPICPPQIPSIKALACYLAKSTCYLATTPRRRCTTLALVTLRLGRHCRRRPVHAVDAGSGGNCRLRTGRSHLSSTRLFTSRAVPSFYFLKEPLPSPPPNSTLPSAATPCLGMISLQNALPPPLHIYSLCPTKFAHSPSFSSLLFFNLLLQGPKTRSIIRSCMSESHPKETITLVSDPSCALSRYLPCIHPRRVYRPQATPW